MKYLDKNLTTGMRNSGYYMKRIKSVDDKGSSFIKSFLKKKKDCIWYKNQLSKTKYIPQIPECLNEINVAGKGKLPLNSERYKNL